MSASEPTTFKPGPAATRTLDRFIKAPWIAAAVLWPVVIALAVIDGDMFAFLFALLLTGIAMLVAFGVLIAHLLARRWEAAASLTLAGAVFLAGSYAAVRNTYELRWLVMQPVYKARIAAAKPNQYGIRGISWDGGMGWDMRLEYHETEAAALAWQERQRGWSGPCRQSLQQLAPHYFLNGLYC